MSAIAFATLSKWEHAEHTYGVSITWCSRKAPSWFHYSDVRLGNASTIKDNEETYEPNYLLEHWLIRHFMKPLSNFVEKDDTLMVICEAREPDIQMFNKPNK